MTYEGDGVDGARLTVEGRGESEPAASNDTDTGRQANRRVEITIVGVEPPASTDSPVDSHAQGSQVMTPVPLGSWHRQALNDEAGTARRRGGLRGCVPSD